MNPSSRTLQEVARELGKTPEEVTPVDLLDYRREDLEVGAHSPLGGEVSNSPLLTRHESETRRLARIGKRVVDDALAGRDGSRAPSE